MKPPKQHPTPLSLDKCTAYFREATAIAFARALNAGQKVMGMRDGHLVIFEKGKAPRPVLKK
jgi:hypothetical protein